MFQSSQILKTALKDIYTVPVANACCIFAFEEHPKLYFYHHLLVHNKKPIPKYCCKGRINFGKKNILQENFSNKGLAVLMVFYYPIRQKVRSQKLQKIHLIEHTCMIANNGV